MTAPTRSEVPAQEDDPRSEARFTRPRPECPEPGLWRSEDIGAAEDEVHDLLAQVVRSLKPTVCVETGAWTGRGTVAIASALAEVGRGHLWSVEVDPEAAEAARAALRAGGLEPWADVETESSLTWTPPGGARIDVAFLDSEATIRGREFLHLYPFMHRRSVLLVHDTGDHRVAPRRELRALARLGLAHVVWCPTPRGVALVQPRFPVGRGLREALARLLLQVGFPTLLRVEGRVGRLRDEARPRDGQTR